MFSVEALPSTASVLVSTPSNVRYIPRGSTRFLANPFVNNSSIDTQYHSSQTSIDQQLIRYTLQNSHLVPMSSSTNSNLP